MPKSIVTEYEGVSAFSGRPAECTHHLIPGSGKRRLADRDGLTIPLTNDEHNTGNPLERIHGNPAAEKLSKMLGQMAWEKEYILRDIPNRDAARKRAREAFRKRYSESYL